MAVQLFPHDRVGQVVVAQVVGRDGAHGPDQVHRQPGVLGDALGVVRQQVGEHVAAVHAHGPDPAQVVQADVLEADPLGFHLQPAGQPALHPDRHVAQPERAVAAVDQCLGHDPDRVREVDDPVPGCGPPVHGLGELQDHGHGADCLGQAAGTGRLLADRAEAGRDGLVAQPRGLAADPELDEHEIGAVQRGIAIGRPDETAGPAGLPEHPLGETADDREALGIDVEQDELVDGQAVGAADHALHQFGRVRAPATDDRHLDAHLASPPRHGPACMPGP